MEAILDLIFENFFIVIIIISAILSIFNKKSKEETNKSPRPKIPSPSPATSRQRKEDIDKPTIERVPEQTIKTNELYQENVNKYEEYLQTNSVQMIESVQILEEDSHHAFSKELKVENELTEKEEQLKEQIGGNLDAKGLINGIIMAEVLGPPRAIKPYRSVIKERELK